MKRLTGFGIPDEPNNEEVEKLATEISTWIDAKILEELLKK